MEGSLMGGAAQLNPQRKRSFLSRRMVLALVVGFGPLTFLAAAIKGRKP
jgi:hypothetical protein